MLEPTRIDIVSLFDLDFKGESISAADIEHLKRTANAPEVDRLFQRSFRWLYYGNTLPTFQRYSFAGPSGSEVRATSLLVSELFGIGVYAVWWQFGADVDPRAAKDRVWNSSSKHLGVLDGLSSRVEEAERHYPFVALLFDGVEADRVASENAVEIGRLLTGGYAHERADLLKSLAADNISDRSYEHLLLRWTDGVGLYANRNEPELYERTFLRAVQLFETCVTVRRVFRRLERRAERLRPTISAATPRPWAVSALAEELAAAERTFIVSPQFRSAEAETLIDRAYARFGVPDLVQSCKNTLTVVDRRYQWAKTQFLVAVAVIAYLLDKLKIFDLLIPWGE